ncbi:hypothetical protein GGQ85_002266 [Nitrobacter vulgaris]|uniref:hypothetical protein n=1 Tax=Nitrobacter vulgaris TaxID=29421 RepID=UPI00285566CC|nr:hypothetical protein [Nitrobacter vulgaris]MDR6304556.1 hypothetical protein [Nitrobacter vulgaris]
MGRPARKLPLSSAVGNSPQFSLTDQDWAKVEIAYGQTLPTAVRQSIVETTNKFLEWEVFERNACALSPAVDLVKSINVASNSLRQKLSRAGGDAGAFGQSVLKEHFRSVHFRKDSYDQLFHALGDVMSSLSAACQSALTEMDDPDAKFFREGASWDDWIRALTNIAEENDLPTASSKAGNPEADVGPFARLVAALQAHLPKEARKHLNTRLSSAIYSARQPLKATDEP